MKNVKIKCSQTKISLNLLTFPNRILFDNNISDLLLDIDLWQLVIIFTQPLRSGDQFFKRSLIGLNSEFSFS